MAENRAKVKLSYLRAPGMLAKTVIKIGDVDITDYVVEVNFDRMTGAKKFLGAMITIQVDEIDINDRGLSFNG